MRLHLLQLEGAETVGTLILLVDASSYMIINFFLNVFFGGDYEALNGVNLNSYFFESLFINNSVIKMCSNYFKIIR